jgi:hypothetical protein
MMELVILPEIKARLFPLREEELRELERSVLEEGIRDPLVVWRKDGQLILVDGHHRYELAKKYNLEFKVVERHFESLDEVLIWIDRNQLGRRNLTDEQRAVIMGRLYKTVKQNPTLNLKQFQKDNGDRVVNLTTRRGSAATAIALAEQLGVGEKTIRNAEKFADAVEALQESFLTGGGASIAWRGSGRTNRVAESSEGSVVVCSEKDRRGKAGNQRNLAGMALPAVGSASAAPRKV